MGHWQKHGLILAPSPEISWLFSHAGSSFAIPLNNSTEVDVYVTGRDSRNQSRIGRVRFDLKNPQQILECATEPTLSLGPLGSFFHTGTSYPWVVDSPQGQLMYFTGWQAGVRPNFQNHLGIAKRVHADQFFVLSNAPILSRTDQEYIGTGSVCVLFDNKKNCFQMWYTNYENWQEQPDGKLTHYYHIKYSESPDGIHWQRENNPICITFEHPQEYAICRPSVLKLNNQYHMWYCYRGDQYRLGYAQSPDGQHWQRYDQDVGIIYSAEGWDSQCQCYPHVFQSREKLYMLYSGNDYGRGGLGLASMPVSQLQF